MLTMVKARELQGCNTACRAANEYSKNEGHLVTQQCYIIYPAAEGTPAINESFSNGSVFSRLLLVYLATHVVPVSGCCRDNTAQAPAVLMRYVPWPKAMQTARELMTKGQAASAASQV